VRKPRVSLPEADIVLAVALGLAAFVLYVLTLSPGIVGGDPGEAQFAPYVLGLMHAPGYPLYTLMGWVWGHAIPLGSVAWRMNLFSAVWAALTVAFAYFLARRLGSERAGAVVAAQAIALSPLFWDWATMAGIRSLTAFSFAVVFYLALKCREAFEKDDDPIKPFLALCLAYGLGLAHHRTIVLLAPALALFLWDIVWERLRKPRILLMALVLLAAPSLLYLYLPIRSLMHPPFDRDHPTTLARFLEVVIFWGAATSAASITWPLLLRRVGVLTGHIASQFRWYGIALGLLGLASLAKEKFRQASLLLISYIALMGFTLVYAPMWGERLNVIIIIPAHFIFALWIGLGADTLIEAPTALGFSRKWANIASIGVFTVCVLALGVAGLGNYRTMMEAREAPLDTYRQRLVGCNARRFAEATLSLVAPRSLIIADWEQATPLWYLQLIEGKRSDVRIISLDDEWKFEMVVEEARREGRPVYAARAFPALSGRTYLDCVGPVVHLREEPNTAVPPEATLLEVNFEGKLALKGYRLWQDSLERGGVLPITLYWQALVKPERDYSFSLRLIGPDGKEVARLDKPAAVLGCYPTHLWSPGEVVGDYYELPLKRNGPPGRYRLEVIVYYPLGPNMWYNLEVNGSEKATVAVFDVK